MKVLVQGLTAAPGGSITVLATLLRNWAADDDIACLTWRPEMARVLRETGHQIIQVEADSTPTALWRTISSHRRQIERWKPDVVFSQEYLLPGVGAPQVVHHRNLLRFEPARSPTLKVRARDAAVALTLRRSAISVFNSHALRTAAVARWPHLAESRTAIVHNPVDVLDFEPGQSCRDPRVARVLVPQSDMRHKRNDMAVKVLDSLCTRLEDQGDPRRVEMSFVGTGDYARVRATADLLGLADRIQFLGYLARPRLAAVYAESDVALITSEKESFCNPIVEAHAAGVPIVTTPLRVFDEISGPLSMKAADDGVESLTTKLVEALDWAPFDAQTAARGQEYTERFSGASKSAELRELLAEAGRTRERGSW